MALQKKTIKIIAIVVTSLVVVGGERVRRETGDLRSKEDSVDSVGQINAVTDTELQVWPRGADGLPQPLIWYNTTNWNSVQTWVQRIDDFLSVYRSHDFRNRAACDFVRKPGGGDLDCEVDLREFDPCTSEIHYGYHRAAPCVFLKLDKIVGWTPNPYNSTEDLPENMPEALKRDIQSVVGRPEANQVWVSCEGVEPADKEFIGPVKYIPRRGLPVYYFPYTNQTGYLSPLVAVLFQRPRIGIVINVECKAWAKNIACEDCEPSASVRFNLFID